MVKYKTTKTDIERKIGNDLRKGGYVFLKNKPCVINKIVKSKPGKHGAAKLNISGYDLFTDKRVDDVYGSQDYVKCPVVVKSTWELINIDDDMLELMNPDGELIDIDIRLPKSKMGEIILDNFNKEEILSIDIISTVGNYRVVHYRILK